jgi:hypothetical protein
MTAIEQPALSTRELPVLVLQLEIKKEGAYASPESFNDPRDQWVLEIGTAQVKHRVHKALARHCSAPVTFISYAP